MPIYEYVCEKCEHCFEYLVFSTNDSPPHCPECKGEKVKKLMSAGCGQSKGIDAGGESFTRPSCAPSGG